MKYTKQYLRSPKRSNVSKAIFGRKNKSLPIIKKNENIKKILIIKSQGIGNVINISPLILKVHQMYPKAEIDLLIRRSCKKVYEGWKIINKIFDTGELQKYDKKKNYNIIIDGVPDGINLNQIFEKDTKIIKGNNTDLRIMHEVKANMKILENIGWKKDFIPNTYIPIKKETQEKINKEFNFKYISISAGYAESPAWSKTKNWGYENYANLIELMKKNDLYKDYKFVILGMRKDSKIIEYLKNKKDIINCVDKYSIQETAAIIKRSEFLISNDTGLSHVATATGTKCYVIFGPTSILKNQPYGESYVICKYINCSPCQFTVNWNTCKKIECMKIKPEEVFSEIIKNERLINRKYKLGIVLTTYNRYEFLVSTLQSLLNCKNLKNVKISIIDDASDDRRISDFLDKVKLSLEKNNNKVIITKHLNNYGKEDFSKTMKEAFNKLENCEYVLFMPDDIIINPYLFDVIEKSYKYFKNDICCLSYMMDNRMDKQYRDLPLYKKLDDIDKYFHYVHWTDGFLSLFKYNVLKNIEFKNTAAPTGSCFWIEINRQLLDKKYKQLRYNESLCTHIGNSFSAMNGHHRNCEPIKSVKVNLLNKPEILNEI